MSFVTRYLEPTLVERLNHLTISARSVVEGATIGQHRSPLKGASIEFRQHRAYVAGDEPRRLDWRVLGRTDRPYIKEYDEETNLRCVLMLDGLARRISLMGVEVQATGLRALPKTGDPGSRACRCIRPKGSKAFGTCLAWLTGVYMMARQRSHEHSGALRDQKREKPLTVGARAYAQNSDGSDGPIRAGRNRKLRVQGRDASAQRTARSSERQERS